MDDMGAWGRESPPEWPENRPGTEETVVNKMEFQALERALETLKEEQKFIFTMHYFEHLPLEEVAGRLGKPLGTIKVYLHRARNTVRRFMEKETEAVT